MRTFFIAIFFLTISVSVFGQRQKGFVQKLALIGVEEKNERRRIEKKIYQCSDSIALLNLRQAWMARQHAQGYLEYDWIYEFHTQRTLQVQIHVGPRYVYDEIALEGINEQYPQRAGIEKLASGKVPVNWEDLENRLKFCLDQYQNEGYPFASFQQLRVQYTPTASGAIAVSVAYTFDAGPLVKIDSVVVQAKIREHPKFVHSLSRLHPGDVYNHKLLNDLPQVLNNSIYYENVKAPRIKFRPDNKADIFIDLSPKETSKFDVLIGILPPNENNQRFQFTGSIDIALLSTFRRGELLEFSFDKLTQSSQQTHFKLVLPYLLNTPLKLSANLDLLKQNEAFQNQQIELAAQYDFSPFLSTSFYFSNKNTRLLGESLSDTSVLELSQLDARRRTVGVGIAYDKLDYRLNPSRGLSTSLRIGLGTRLIRENVLIRQTRPEFYEDLDRELPSREIDFSLKWFIPLIPRHVLHVANHSYWLDISDVLKNDQLQVGGSRSIRGFNENQFFTDFYSFFSLEYRLQLERNSYLFLFGDYAYMEDNEAGEILHPLSTGLGMNYGTKAGIISISYAIGRSETLPFQPARGRVHIGLINQF